MTHRPAPPPSPLINCVLWSHSHHNTQLIRRGDVAVCRCGHVLTASRAPHTGDPIPGPVDRGTRSALAAVSRAGRRGPRPARRPASLAAMLGA